MRFRIFENLSILILFLKIKLDLLLLSQREEQQPQLQPRRFYYTKPFRAMLRPTQWSRKKNHSSIKQQPKYLNFYKPFPSSSTRAEKKKDPPRNKRRREFLWKGGSARWEQQRGNYSGFDGSTLSGNPHPGLLEGNQPDNPINKLASIHVPHVPIVVLDLIDYLSPRSVYYSQYLRVFRSFGRFNLASAWNLHTSFFIRTIPRCIVATFIQKW